MQEEATSVDRSRDADSLRAAFGREGCPVCIVVLDSIQRSMDTWQYEGFTDVEHRHELIRSKGFCPLHTWQLAQLNTPFQLAMVYQGVLTDVLSRLNHDYSKFASTHQSKSRRGFVWKGLWGRERRRKDENSLFERCSFWVAYQSLSCAVVFVQTKLHVCSLAGTEQVKRHLT